MHIYKRRRGSKTYEGWSYKGLQCFVEQLCKEVQEVKQKEHVAHLEEKFRLQCVEMTSKEKCQVNMVTTLLC